MRKLDRFVEVFGRRDLVFELIKNRTRLFYHTQADTFVPNFVQVG